MIWLIYLEQYTYFTLPGVPVETFGSILPLSLYNCIDLVDDSEH